MLEHGADADAVNRMGQSTLMQAIMGHDLPSVRLLAEAGADPSMRDNTGTTPLSMVKLFPEAMAVMSDAGKRGRTRAGGLRTGKQVVLEGLTKKELNDQVGSCGTFDAEAGRYSVTLEGTSAPIAVKCINVKPFCAAKHPKDVCAHCKDPEKPATRCKGCLSVSYCSPECQNADWKKKGGDGHNKKCKEQKAGLVMAQKPLHPEVTMVRTVSQPSYPVAVVEAALMRACSSTRRC